MVAILGLVGGFLTPALLSTGQDNPLGLFSYIALLDVGLLALAFHRRWRFLALMAAVGTLLLQLGWMSEFFVRERYFDGSKCPSRWRCSRRSRRFSKARGGGAGIGRSSIPGSRPRPS